MVGLAVHCTPAQAQTSALDWPHRGAALRPTGMVETSTMWSTGRVQYAGGDFFEEHHFAFAVDARVPIESLLLEVSVLDVVSVLRASDGDETAEGTYNALGNPRVGASWHSADDAGLRLEIGGALNIPYLARQNVQRLELGSAGPGYGVVIVPDRARLRGGWSAFQLTDARFAVTAHARVELDPSPDLAIGGELDLPLVFQLDRGQTVFLPQLAVEGAYRFFGFSLVGLRLQGVVVHIAGRYGFDVLLEPFLRLAQRIDAVAAYGAVSVQLDLGPDHPPSFSGSPVRGLFGLKLGGGVLF